MPKEKEKKKKEDAEKKQKEEEAARARFEIEEAERKRLEQIAKEESLKVENEERKIRRVQLEELEAIWANSRNQLRNEVIERRKLAKWARYMKCDGSPDPTVLCEINNFMTLLREDQIKYNFNEIIDNTHLMTNLIEELETLLADSLDDDMTDLQRTTYRNVDRLEKYRNANIFTGFQSGAASNICIDELRRIDALRMTMNELQDLLTLQLDLASHKLLCKASAIANTDTNNLEQIISNDLLTLCMWGNLSKNPRIKSYEFMEKGLYFELPKVLTLSDCAIRALFTTFDHISCKSKSYFLTQEPKPKLSILKPEPEVSVVAEVIDVVEEMPKKDSDDDDDDDADDILDPDSDDDIQASLKKLEKEAEEKRIQADKEKEERLLAESVADFKLPTPEPREYEEFEGDDETIDLRAFHVVGGILYFNLLQMPPQPRVVKNWTITQMSQYPELQYMEYKMDVVPLKPPDTAEDGKRDSAEKIDTDTPIVKKEERPAISITLRLPENVYFCEEPQIARWDYTENNWRTDGFLDRVYNEAGRLLTFRICEFGTLALIQDAHINMPFQSWELRTRGINHAQLTIIASIIEVEIQIKDGSVCLSQPADKPELAHLIGNWMPIHELIKRMRSSGANVFPDEDSFKYVKIVEKHPLAEDRLYQQIGLVASAMSFAWSRWNFDVNDYSKILLQGAEHLKDEPLLEFEQLLEQDIAYEVARQNKEDELFSMLACTDEDWSLFLVTKTRAAKLNMKEFSEQFSDERASGTSYNSNMYHLAMETLSENGKQRIAETSPVFTENVYQVLRSTRIIPYS